MVDALCGIWRSLADSGTLVDLRPLSGQCPIELVSAGAVVHVGEADATGMADDDAVSDQAIQDIIARGHFVALRDTQFDFDFYWDTVQEMASFIESSRRMKHVRPSYAELEKAHSALSAGGRERVRLRCQRRTTLAVYQKQAYRPVDPLQGAS